MKCPKCDGTGNAEFDSGIFKWVSKCDQCNGKGIIEPMTNEQWLRSATFEELAGAIYEWHSAGYTSGRVGLGLNPITEIVEWLKEKHE